MRTSLSKPFSAKAKFLMLIMAFLFTLLLTACGSSSSSSSATPTPDVSASGDQLNRISEATKTNSVVQSTNFDSSDTSQDEFNTTLMTDNEVIRFTHTDATGGVGVITVDFKFSDAEVFTATEVTAAGIEFGDTHPAISFTGINDYEELDDGYLWTDIFISNLTSTAESASDTDWLLGGVWLYTPKSATAEDYEIGAFVDASDSLSQAITDSHTADPVYRGGATGTFLAGKTTNGWAGGGYFDAKIALTATFAGSSRDFISGSIYDVEITEAYGSASTEDVDGFVLQLEFSDNIRADGFYQGTTTSNSPDGAHTGFWGGEFFNTDGDEDNIPEATGGTFSGSNVGVAADDDASVFVGAFITTRDE